MSYRAAGQQRQEFLSHLQLVINKKFKKGKADKIASFVQVYYGYSPLEELTQYSAEDLYGSTLSTWDFFQRADLSKPKVRVYNPELEKHGWQSNRTVIEVVAKDSPFLVDSIRMELNRLGLRLNFVNNVVMNVVRDEQFEVVELHPVQEVVEGSQPEALMLFEVAKIGERSRLKILEAEISGILEEVRVSVTDFAAMLKEVHSLRQAIMDEAKGEPSEDQQESIQFLDWLVTDNFTFLGYKAYDVKQEQSEAIELEDKETSCLGMLRVNKRIDILEKDFSVARDRSRFVFAKSASKSRVHRPAYFDLIVVRRFNPEGDCIGESRILGLFTSRVYHCSVKTIPVLRKKLQATVEYSGFAPGGHDYKSVNDIVANLPKDELFQMEQIDLNETVMGILHMQERPSVKAFFREDPFNRFVTTLIYAPRDKYSTALREKFQDIICSYIPVADLEYYAHFSESLMARAYIIMRLEPGKSSHFNRAEVETLIRKAARTWEDDFVDALVDTYGEEKGLELAQNFGQAFPASYREDFQARSAVADLEKIMEVQAGAALGMSFYRTLEDEENCYRIKLYRASMPFAFSTVLNIFENLGLKVSEVLPYEIRAKKAETYYFNDFRVTYCGTNQLFLDDIKVLFQEAFEKIWAGAAENDGFNKLILGASLNWRQVMLLRGYAKYLQQTGFALSQSYIEEALVNHSGITAQLVKLFEERFNPDRQIGNDQREQKAIENIKQALEGVENLDEDRIIRRYLDVMQGTLRTNFYQLDNDSHSKHYVCYKLDSQSIPDLPKPAPTFEVFVYSSYMEGVHLRGGKVARGGLRWSERKEDFRTEVLGLVKAQQVKNAVIVPVGAKGGFIAKRVCDQTEREEAMKEVVSSYQTFIRGLLDITDNLVDDSVVKPNRVVCKDGDDPYLVVAADKGTATFSDIANEIAAEYKFWLGDAFASGGSVGYDHKKMGITARGAWVSVQRHFREMGTNVQEEPVTVVGVGDMGGDVFGNGMLQSETLKLVAAFNHMHIFVDPNPDPTTSFAERKRLFEKPRSSWSDYNKELISAGGGVHLRSAKSIRITEEMKSCFGIEADSLTPNELISALLKSPVDLIWNGGIGTYIKSSLERDSEVGDKANDSVRVNGCEVRAKIIGEGGNLGITQLGRVEYAAAGGRSNTDFIDNSGGVDCSDHEVNIKILLNDVVHNGDMTSKQRNSLLLDMTEEVAQLVLNNNYQQAQAISIAQMESARRLEEYKRFIHSLEQQGKLDREIEFIPSDEELSERKNQNEGLHRPELATLFCYCKSNLKEALIASQLPDDPYITATIERVFPKVLSTEYGAKLRNHKLRREIVATEVSNALVNYMGITFIHRMKDATGASEAQIAKGFMLACDVFRLEEIWGQIEKLDYKVSSDAQMHLMTQVIRLVRRATRWFLRNKRCEFEIEKEIAAFKPGVERIFQDLNNLIVGYRLETWQAQYDYYLDLEFPEVLAKVGASCDSLLPILGIIEAAEITKRPVELVARVYFNLGSSLDLFWFGTKIDQLRVENHWQAIAREAYRDDLDWQQRSLTISILQLNDSEDYVQNIEQWMEKQQLLVGRWKSMVSSLRLADLEEFSMYSVALRELMDLAQSSLYAKK